MTTDKIVNYAGGQQQVAFEFRLFAYLINTTIRQKRTKIRNLFLLLIESDGYFENIAFASLNPKP